MSEVDVTKLYENLPDNSHKSRNEKKDLVSEKKEEKRAEKVVHGKVKKKENGMRKLTDIFISEDVTNVKDYIIFDVVVPALKKAVYDLIVGTLDMSLYGGRGNGNRPKADRVSYRDYNDISRSGNRSGDRTRTASGYSYDDIVVETDRKSVV